MKNACNRRHDAGTDMLRATVSSRGPDAGEAASGFFLPAQFITLTEVVLALPAASRAVTEMVWVPLLALRLFQL